MLKAIENEMVFSTIVWNWAGTDSDLRQWDELLTERDLTPKNLSSDPEEIAWCLQNEPQRS
jgi:hypothetical protein